jgi:G3E family GTPase
VLAGIPVNLVSGRDPAAKSRVLGQILDTRPSGARWAVLINEGGAGAPATEAVAPGVYFGEVAQGCICCTAQLPLRVGLTRLLRETEPERLFIQVPARARTGEIVRLLTDRWLSPVLSLRATIHVLVAAGLQGLLDDEIHVAQLAAAQVVAVDDSDAAIAERDMVARHLSTLKGAPVIARLRPDGIDSALLDLPGPLLAARFQTDVARR